MTLYDANFTQQVTAFPSVRLAQARLFKNGSLHTFTDANGIQRRWSNDVHGIWSTPPMRPEILHNTSDTMARVADEDRSVGIRPRMGTNSVGNLKSVTGCSNGTHGPVHLRQQRTLPTSKDGLGNQNYLRPDVLIAQNNYLPDTPADDEAIHL